jgi:hypothetical protein
MIIYLILCFSLIMIIFYDTLFLRNYRRYNYYNQALTKSKELNKKLLVVGCPLSGGVSGKISLLFNLYKCGDILVDIKAESSCPNFISSDLKTFLSSQQDDSFVIFVSVVLEYVDDVNLIIKELERVSGNHLYVVPIDVIWEKWFKINLGNYNKLRRKNLAVKWAPKYKETHYVLFKK